MTLTKFCKIYMYPYVIVTKVSSNMPYVSQYNIISSSNSHTTLGTT